MIQDIRATAHMKREVDIFTVYDMEHIRKRVNMESPPPMWGLSDDGVDFQ